MPILTQHPNVLKLKRLKLLVAPRLSKYDNPEAVKISLFKHRANQNHSGISSLMFAAEECFFECVKNFAFLLASEVGDLDIIECFVEYGADRSGFV